MVRSKDAPSVHYKHWIFLLLLALAIYVLLPQLKTFHVNWQQLEHARHLDVMLGVAAVVSTYLAATISYLALAHHRLSGLKTFIVQLASMFANRLLPAGTGTIGTNYAYLRRSGHTAAQAASTVAVNNSLGFIGNMLLVLMAVVFWHRQLPAWHRPDHAMILWLCVLAAFVPGLCIVVGSRLRRRVAVASRQVVRQILTYRQRPGRLGLAFLAAMVITMGNVAGLYFSAQALGLQQVSLVACLLALTVGVGVGTATPTPGGLGGVEAGLVAGLVAYGVPDAAALATVLVYRLISYWLALVAGAGAFVYTGRRGYL